MKKLHIAAAALLAAVVVTALAPAVGPPAMAATSEGSEVDRMTDAAAFARLKSLAGTWTGKIDDAQNGVAIRLSYEVASGGKAVIEKVFPGTPDEMVTVYFLASGRLRATHYCAMGNQPAFAFREGPAGRMMFDFAGGTGFDPKADHHVHEGYIEPQGSDRMVASWSHYRGEKKQGSMIWYLSRG